MKHPVNLSVTIGVTKAQNLDKMLTLPVNLKSTSVDQFILWILVKSYARIGWIWEGSLVQTPQYPWDFLQLEEAIDGNNRDYKCKHSKIQTHTNFTYPNNMNNNLKKIPKVKKKFKT